MIKSLEILSLKWLPTANTTCLDIVNVVTTVGNITSPQPVISSPAKTESAGQDSDIQDLASSLLYMEIVDSEMTVLFFISL